MLRLPRRLRAPRAMLAIGVLAVITLPVACKSNSEAPVKVASTNVTVPMNNATTSALTGVTFTIPNGAGALSPSLSGQTLALTFNNTAGNATTATGTITNPSGGTIGTFSANTTFGSCIFTLTTSTLDATTYPGLQPPQTITIDPCTAAVATAGEPADGTAHVTVVTLSFGQYVSTQQSVSVQVTGDGTVSINGKTVGTVTVTNGSGA